MESRDVRRVLLVATTTGYQIRSFGEAATKLGVRLLLASDRCDRLEDPWWDRAIPVRFHEEARSIESIVVACSNEPPHGILAVGDRPVVLAARAARAFGLQGHPPGAAATSRNKLLTRKALGAAGLPTPWFLSVSVDSDPVALAHRVPYPAVVKPLALSGSRGVMRVDNVGDCVTAVERLRRLLRSPDVRVEREEAHDKILVESFIAGKEYAIEGVLDRGAFRLLAIFDKPDPLDGPFFEETIYVAPSTASPVLQTGIASAIADASAAMGLHHGPIHAECRVTGETVYVLEVAARPIGGLCSRALRFRNASEQADTEEASLEEILLRHAIGEDISNYARVARASGVMMIPIPTRGVFRRVDGLDEARAVPGVTDLTITVKADAPIVPLPEGRSYLGFMFASAETSQAVEFALRDAHARLRLVVDREVTVV